MDRTCLGVVVAVGMTLALVGACAPEQEVEPGALGPCGVEVDDTGLYNRVFSKISARQPDGRALYQTWPVYPGEPKLKRLGLAVHGRWTTVYVDPDHAFPFLENAIENGHEQPLELPPGSILVKENYRSSPGATAISPDQSTLEVLTVMVKPEPGEAVPEGSLKVPQRQRQLQPGELLRPLPCAGLPDRLLADSRRGPQPSAGRTGASAPGPCRRSATV